jgi:glutamine---fructose-6-phosphate transaminase (isomerizing)
MADEAAFATPLPGAPDPWVASSMPELMAGPPYLMARMIAAEPALAERVALRVASSPAGSALAAAIAAALDRGDPVTTTGCGTSEHAALAAAALIAEAVGPGKAHLVRCWQALDLARAPQGTGLVIGISHEGGTSATNQAITAARSAGARTAIVTVTARSPGGTAAEIAVETGEQDQSWCHTVGYVSPMVAMAAVASLLRGEALEVDAIRAVLSAGLQEERSAQAAASALAGCHRLLVAGAGVDLVSARELALKVEEGSALPATALHLETVRHGHLAAADASTGLVLILTDSEPGGEAVVARAGRRLRSAEALGMPAAAIAAPRIQAALPAELLTAGRLNVPEAAGVPSPAASLLGAAVPLQLLALHLAMARGRNPDAIGRDDPRQAAAAEA